MYVLSVARDNSQKKPGTCPSGPGPRFWVSLEAMGPHSAPPPGAIFGGFWLHFGAPLEPKSSKVGVDYRCVFRMVWRGFGVVLGLFWVIFLCQNDDEKEKGGFVEILVLPK